MIGAWTSRKSRSPRSATRRPMHHHDREIGRHDAEPGFSARAHQPHRQAVLEHEQVERRHAEHDDRVALQAVESAAPRRQALVLAHGQGVDVAGAAPAEMAGGGVVHGMGAPPVAVGRERQHAQHPAEPVVGAPPAEERAVAAVVLDHEQAHEEARRRHREQQAEPVGIAEAEQHQEPQGHERHRGDDQLDQAAREARLAVGGQCHRPVPRIRLGRSVRPGVALGMLDRLLHHGPLVAVRGDSSCPLAECRAGLLRDRPGSPTDRRSAWRVEMLTEAPVATESPGRH